MYSFKSSTTSFLSIFGARRTLINSNTVRSGRLVSRPSKSCLEGLPEPHDLNSFSSSQMSSSKYKNRTATSLKSPLVFPSSCLSSRFHTLVYVSSERDFKSFKETRTTKRKGKLLIFMLLDWKRTLL